MESRFYLKFLTLFLVLHRGTLSPTQVTEGEIMKQLETEESKMINNLRFNMVTRGRSFPLLNEYMCLQIKDGKHYKEPRCEGCYQEIFSLEGIKNAAEFMRIYNKCTRKHPPHYFKYMEKKAQQLQALEKLNLEQICTEELNQVMSEHPTLYGNAISAVNMFTTFAKLLFTFNWFMEFDYSPQHLIYMEEVRTNFTAFPSCIGHMMEESEKHVIVTTKTEDEKEKITKAITDLGSYINYTEYFIHSLCLNAEGIARKGCQNCYSDVFKQSKIKTNQVSSKMLMAMDICRNTHDPYGLTYATVEMRRNLKTIPPTPLPRSCEAQVFNITKELVNSKIADHQDSMFHLVTTMLQVEFSIDWFIKRNAKNEKEVSMLETVCKNLSSLTAMLNNFFSEQITKESPDVSQFTTTPKPTEPEEQSKPPNKRCSQRPHPNRPIRENLWRNMINSLDYVMASFHRNINCLINP